jgi:hypothetical protein
MTEAVYEEATGAERVERLPLAHLSIEVGHLCMEDFRGGPEHLRRLMEQVAPWERAARDACARQLRPATARISTCFLVDDYFTRFSSPREVVPQILAAARAAGVGVDYLAREAACVRAEGVDLAGLVEARLVTDPPRGTTGSRPPLSSTGWLCNGEPSPQPDHRQAPLPEAMRAPPPWRPPSENGANRHSIFIDVQLWDEVDGERRWSCPYLAAVWQLLRLGLLRDTGQSVVRPRVWTGELPEAWSELPPVVQLTERPAAFCAFRTFSVLAGRFLPIEHAVRTILGQFDVGRSVRAQLLERAATERPVPLALPPEIIDRIEYVFAGTPWH